MATNHAQASSRHPLPDGALLPIVDPSWIVSYPSRHPKQLHLYLAVPAGIGMTTDRDKAHRFATERLATLAAENLHSRTAPSSFASHLERGTIQIEKFDQFELPLEVSSLVTPTLSPMGGTF